jgi:predicted ATP-grasp superfamily ATP-dependent carboligase
VVFVTDGLLRKSVVVCQSLGRRGVDVAVGSTTPLSPAFFSRYCRERVLYPCPRRDPDGFAEAALEYLRRARQPVTLPTDDATLQAVSRHRRDFERVTHVPVPEPDRLAYGFDKGLTTRLAARLGIPHPATTFPRSPEEARLQAAELGRPVVVKPRGSSGGRGMAYPESLDEVAERWAAVDATHPQPMLQERLPTGPKYDACILMDFRGRAVATFVQRELRHFPVQDGLSTLQESVWRPDLVERAVALLRAIGWYGLAEVEFMEHPETGEALLLEINPRFWASVQLAIACGVDFPYLLHQVALGQPVDEVHTYTLGQRCRWLLPGDLLHFLSNPDRGRMDPPFFRFRDGATTYDGLYRDDPGATLGVLLSCGHYLFDRDLWGLLGRRARRGPAVPAGQPPLAAPLPKPLLVGR